MVIVLSVGLVLLLAFAADRQMCLAGLKKDLSGYLDQAEEVVRIADDPRVVIHYKAVVFAVSGIYNSYFPTKDLRN